MTKHGYMKTRAKIGAAVLSALIFVSCNNIRAVTSNLASSTTAGAVGDNYTLSNVTILPASSSTASSATYNVSLYFAVTTVQSISNHCNTAGKPCSCQFSWPETNTTTAVPTTVQRSVVTAVTQVQPNVVVCSAPAAYSTTPAEIPNGTQIAISVIAGSGNSDVFSMTPFNYTMETSVVAGSFQDSQGRSFDNILRYGCYNRFARGLSVVSYVSPVSDPNTGESRNIPLASKYCTASSTGGTSSTTNCPGLAQAAYSAQANYYNLYIRSSERGDINNGNTQYVCPLVDRPLPSQASAGVGSTVQNYWPLDSSFALSLGAAGIFNIGVQAYTETDPGDGTTASSTCFTSASPTPAPSVTTTTGVSTTGAGLINSCLGFAATPNSDGTCPYINNSSGQVVPLYRLRRYIAIYPKVFDTNGQPYPGIGQASDTIYVIDRPVSSPFADPLKPYTMRGPKPCPFSYYDKQKVLGIADPVANGDYLNNTTPGYGATNNTFWTGTNVDGIQFPNVDIGDDVDNNISCSAIVPVVDPLKQVLSLGTVNASNPALKKLYIRPTTAWAPHYEEDLSFKACAPLAQPGIQDPPLHFSKDSSGNVSYCAEVAPTQNPNITALDTIAPTGAPHAGDYGGRVSPFTSHVVKNSLSAVCAAEVPTIPALYPAEAGAGACPAVCPATQPAGLIGYAYHPTNMSIDTNNATASCVCANKTCDRTVTNTGLDWLQFPLLARPSNVEAAMAADPSYDCAVTWDNGGSRSQNKSSPSQGCCGASVTMTTGAAGFSSAHLEPDVSCAIPTY